MKKTAIVALIGATLALNACASLRSARNAIVRAPPECKDAHIAIYFDPGQAEITRDGRRLIAAEAARARRCRVESVDVVGLADATGDPAANMALAEKRARSVAAAIQEAGLPAAKFDLEAAGAAGAVTKEGELRPVRRQADVTLHLSQPK